MHAARQARSREAVTLRSTKGIGFTNARQYVLTHHGEAGWQRVLAELGAGDRVVLLSVLPVGWYDVLLFARLLRAIDRVFGRGDLGLMHEIGVFEAEQDFNRVLRVFLRVLTPSSVFRAEGRLWRHFQDSGEWNSEPIPGGMHATLTGWASDEALCAELTGYLVRLVQFTGGTHVSVEHERCVARGDRACVFVYRWQ